MHACAVADLFPCNMHNALFSISASSSFVYVCVCNRFGKHSALSFACRQLDLWQDATLVVVLACIKHTHMWCGEMRDCAAQSHLLPARAFFFCQLHLLMKLYVHVCCRKKTHFWITTCPASSRYLRTNDRDSAGYLLISVSTTLLLCLFFSLLSSEHTPSDVVAWPKYNYMWI
jgi:hypothetical protein